MYSTTMNCVPEYYYGGHQLDHEEGEECPEGLVSAVVDRDRKLRELRPSQLNGLKVVIVSLEVDKLA